MIRPLLNLFKPRPTLYQGEDESAGMVHLDGARKRAIEIGRTRLIVTGAMFTLAFCVIAGRMVDVTVIKSVTVQHSRQSKSNELGIERADVVDRNGVLLATSLPSVSLYAHPHEIGDKKEAAQKIARVLPDINANDLQSRLQGDRAFLYLRRNLTPRQEYEINALGIPGLYFEKAEKRIYPQSELTAHVVGLTDLDNKGIAGIEKAFENELKARRDPLRLSLDIRVQTVLRNELAKTVADFHAIGATGMVMDVRTGELLGMVSLPDFNPNNLASATPEAMFNRATSGVYEMGSTFKLYNTAAALDAGTSTLSSTYDVTHKIKVGRFEIYDYEPEHHPMNVAEILKVSSNIGSARMALDLGIDNQKAFLSRMGLMRPASIELPEISAPLVPNPWREINSMTIAYGHGMAVSPLHMMTGVSTLVNGGNFHSATLLRHDDGQSIPSQRVLKPETSKIMRDLMRMVVVEGTGKKADVPGYDVGGKTGTAEKNGAGGYRHKSLLSSFIATFPVSDPKYVVLAMIDEPQGNKESYGFATAGWTAAPAVGRVIAQIGPLLGLMPSAIPEPAAKEKARLAQDAPPQQKKGVSLAKAE
ncbi:peptidoglycan D,D-transpeptidase FtsI family protein [Telmatospirillum siberiense]|uniref:Penicillin-binding protein n=1 Tax=Telmatospirillum siberiense TaxID=382514 RepID=A0A2N3PQL9_9PROT|nr:penicillin-binding protein 2 [Telmatospirillum siberiense]PKU22682.1 penicillin-binding protein [Telmatospirillum siberiense]